MAYKTILVHCNDEHRQGGLLRAALPIARASGAHLVGLAVLPPIIIVPGSEGIAGTVIEDHRETYRPQLQRMRMAFDAATREAGITAEWRELDCQAQSPFGDVAMVAVREARCADLVIASEANTAWSMSAHLDVPEPLILESGRPVLLVPKSGAFAGPGRRILLAWNDSREAARAVNDAMPLLEAAEAVLIARVAEREDDERQLQTADIAAMLARHGVRCEALGAVPRGTSVGAAILDAAHRNQADLIVMGCYGHSRMRELLLGGTSRHILEHLRLPVLMSH